MKNHPEFMPSPKKVETKQLEEAMGVMGMTSIPGIDRMKVLAGIKPQSSVAPGETNDPENPNNTENNGGQIQNNNQMKANADNGNDNGNNNGKPNMRQNNNGQPEDENNVQESFVTLNFAPDAAEICLEAIKTLKESIGDVRVNELAQVRRSILELVTQIDESISFGEERKKSNDRKSWR